MKRTGSFLFLFLALLSTLSLVFSAPIPADLEVRNEVLKRSPNRIAPNDVSFHVVAQAKLKQADHKASEYPNGMHPERGHIQAAHEYINSPAFAAAYPHLANEPIKSAMIVAPNHRGGHGNDPNKHITVNIRTHAGADHKIHVPANNLPAVSNQIMNMPMTKDEAKQHLGHTKRALDHANISFRPDAQAKLKMAGHTAAQYPNGLHPERGHTHAVHEYVNSAQLHADYPHLAGQQIQSATIIAPNHVGGNGGDQRKHITVQVHTAGGASHKIHVPAPNLPGVGAQIMNMPMTPQEAQDHLNHH